MTIKTYILALFCICRYTCEVAGIPAAEFDSSKTQDVRKPILLGVAFFVSVPQLMGRILRGFMPAAFLGSRSVNLVFGSSFLFDSKIGEYFYDPRGAAMRAQTPPRANSAQQHPKTTHLFNKTSPSSSPSSACIEGLPPSSPSASIGDPQANESLASMQRRLQFALKIIAQYPIASLSKQQLDLYFTMRTIHKDMKRSLAFFCICRYACEVAAQRMRLRIPLGNTAAEFCSSMTQDVRKPILLGVAFFVSVPQLMGRILRGFMPAAFLGSRSANLVFGSSFLFCSEIGEYFYDPRGAAMRAQTPPRANSAQQHPKTMQHHRKHDFSRATISDKNAAEAASPQANESLASMQRRLQFALKIIAQYPITSLSKQQLDLYFTMRTIHKDMKRTLGLSL